MEGLLKGDEWRRDEWVCLKRNSLVRLGRESTGEISRSHILEYFCSGANPILSTSFHEAHQEKIAAHLY